MSFSRRNRVDLMSLAELAIRAAVQVVERAGAHPLLTDAVNLLAEAQTKVADYVDGPGAVQQPARSEAPDYGLSAENRIAAMQATGWSLRDVESPYLGLPAKSLERIMNAVRQRPAGWRMLNDVLRFERILMLVDVKGGDMEVAIGMLMSQPEEKDRWFIPGMNSSSFTVLGWMPLPEAAITTLERPAVVS
jgi:hypothetical protein